MKNLTKQLLSAHESFLSNPNDPYTDLAIIRVRESLQGLIDAMAAKPGSIASPLVIRDFALLMGILYAYQEATKSEEDHVRAVFEYAAASLTMSEAVRIFRYVTKALKVAALSPELLTKFEGLTSSVKFPVEFSSDKVFPWEAVVEMILNGLSLLLGYLSKSGRPVLAVVAGLLQLAIKFVKHKN